MSKVYTGSPVPFRKSDPDPLFKSEDGGYIVRKSYSPIERQRMADGTQHSMNRPSAVEAKDYDLYIGEDKVSKSKKKEEDKSLNVKERDPDEIIKAFMEA